MAKQQRQKRNYLRKQSFPAVPHVSAVAVEQVQQSYEKIETAAEEAITIDAVIRFLRSWKTTYQDLTRHIKALEKELKEKDEELFELRVDNERLSKEVNNVQIDYRTVNDDYKTLIQIMDRARRLASMNEEEEVKSRFKMDANGNLERIE